MFFELHTRSAFSFLSSGSIPEEMAGCASELGIDGVGLLDRDTVAGAVRFHFKAKELGIKPIIGSEITMDDGSLLPLVPTNLKGYQNLSKLINLDFGPPIVTLRRLGSGSLKRPEAFDPSSSGGLISS